MVDHSEESLSLDDKGLPVPGAVRGDLLVGDELGFPAAPLVYHRELLTLLVLLKIRHCQEDLEKEKPGQLGFLLSKEHGQENAGGGGMEGKGWRWLVWDKMALAGVPEQSPRNTKRGQGPSGLWGSLHVAGAQLAASSLLDTGRES